MQEYRYPLVKDTIDETDLKELANWLLKKPRLTKGDLTARFEHEWSEWVGSKYSIFVNSGSSANLLMIYSLLLLERLQNKKIVVPAVGWVTTVSPIIQLGLEPLICDCDPVNLGLDVDHFEKICRQTRPAVAIIVHVLGHPNEMSKICEICKRYGVLLLEDCCEAHGSEYCGKKVGTFGVCGSFSFYFGHQMSTIEGGMVITDDEELHNVMLSVRSHGWSRDLESGAAAELRKKYDIDDFRNRYTFYYPGFNLRSTDLNAFLGLRQLKKLDSTIQRRHANYNKYRDALKPFCWVQESKGNPISSFAFGLIVDDLKGTVDILESNLIETRPLVCGSLGEQPFWIEKYGKSVLPMATRVHGNGLYISVSQDLTGDDIEAILDVLLTHFKSKHL